MKLRRFGAAGALAVILLCIPRPLAAYSVLTHEADVDAAWDRYIQPLLLDRFPNATSEELAHARAYAYGGCIIQDMGYYPFGSHLFSNLTHYVRSGDFIQALLHDAQDINEYAFALGALGHYAADNAGHPLAVNPSVALLYPKLRKRYGDRVTYAESPKSHIMVEFSFDVVQVAGHAYLPQTYHTFIGFQVARGLLERAFYETYGIQMKSIFFSENLAIETYRHAVGKTIPEMTKVAWRKKRAQIEQLKPDIRRERFVFRMRRGDYEREFGKDYEKPRGLAAFIGFIYSLVPKIGPLRAFGFKVPTPQAEGLFIHSFQTTTETYQRMLTELRAGSLALPNMDFDTGRSARWGEYSLADETHLALMDHLRDNHFAAVPLELRKSILGFFGTAADSPESVPGDPQLPEKIRKQLAELKSGCPGGCEP